MKYYEANDYKVRLLSVQNKAAFYTEDIKLESIAELTNAGYHVYEGEYFKKFNCTNGEKLSSSGYLIMREPIDLENPNLDIQYLLNDDGDHHPCKPMYGYGDGTFLADQQHGDVFIYEEGESPFVNGELDLLEDVGFHVYIVMNIGDEDSDVPPSFGGTYITLRGSHLVGERVGILYV